MKERFRGKVVWITGGGSGLGEALARAFAREGAHVAVSGRRLARIEQVASALGELGGRGLAVPCDVTQEDEITRAVDRVVRTYGGIDVAVANAGVSVSGRIQDLSADDWRRQLEINVVGAAMTAKHALGPLAERKGRLVLVGSVAGMVCAPGFAPYHASKYAVRAIGQTLAMELHGTGVTCTTIHPGFVESEIGQVDNQGVHHPEWEDRRPRKLMWRADDAARVMLNAIHARKREYTFTGHGKLAGWMGRHAPGLVHVLATRAPSAAVRGPPKTER